MSVPDPEISVIVPAKDERDNLGELIAEIAGALEGRPFEIIVVDDGSGDGTAECLAELAQEAPYLRGLRHETSCGQSASVRSGLHAARGRIIVTIDGDGENDGDDGGRGDYDGYDEGWLQFWCILI